MDDLKRIARHAMLERGLLPDFSPEALAQAKSIASPAGLTFSPAVRDLRDLLWASIDNDDSQDLDQLSVAVPVTQNEPPRNGPARDGPVKILVAIADECSELVILRPSILQAPPTQCGEANLGSF